MAPTPEEIKLLELAARHAISEEGSNLVRSRIDTLLDKGSFEEIGKFVTHRATDFDMPSQRPLGDGVITGYGRIHGRIVCLFAHDAVRFGGTLSEANTAKIIRLIDTAIRIGAPLIGLHDSSGLRIQESIDALAASADLLYHHTLANGVIPQISVLLSPCTGISALAPSLTDFTLTAPHLATLRELLTILPSSNRDLPPYHPTTDNPDRTDRSLDTLIPATNQPYDMLSILTRIVDQDEIGNGYFLQTNEHHAPSLLTGFARMNGRPVGIVANQPSILNGALNQEACVKAARFVRFCDAFHLPLITFADAPSPSPSADIHPLAQLLSAFAKANVPKLTVITRRAHGAAYAVMGSKHLRADLNLAWPTAEIVVDDPEAAINILHQRELDSILRHMQAIMPQGVSLSEEKKLEILAETRNEKTAAYRDRFANPYLAAERGYIDAVIRPSETRRHLNLALDRLSPKHGNDPR